MWKVVADIIKEFPVLPLYALCWVVGVIHFKKYFDTALKHFPLFIGYTLLNELLGFLIKNYPDYTLFTASAHDWHNIILYNIYAVLTMLYFTGVYYTLIKNPMYRKWILGAVGVFFLSIAISLVFQDPLHEALVYSFATESLVIVLFVFLHIKEIKQTPALPPQEYNLMFWIDRGLLTFHLPFPLICFMAFQYYAQVYKPLHLATVLNLCIAAMHILFIIGFIHSSRPVFR